MNNALWLPSIDVIEMKTSAGLREITAACNTKLESCPKCGTVGRLYRHGVKRHTFTEAPAYGEKVVIYIDVQRYRCRECGATTNQPLPDMDEQRQMTRRCREYIERQGVPQTYATLARTIGIDEKTVRNICNTKFDRLMAEWKVRAPSIMGIDELTLGGRKRTIFVDGANRGRLIDMIDAMNRGKVERWLYALPNRDHVQVVTIDMWGPYKQAVRTVLPQAKIVIDKWHVLSKAGIALDKVRNRARRGSKNPRKNPWSGKRLLQTSRHRLSPARQFALDGIIKNNPLIEMGWNCKEAFYDIWDAEYRYDAEEAFDKWAASIPPEVELEFRPVAKMVENWREEIFAYFAYWEMPISNAATEARNGLIKMLNRAGRGYSFHSIRAKALLMPLATKMGECKSCKAQLPVSELRIGTIERPCFGWSCNWFVCADCEHDFHKPTPHLEYWVYEQNSIWGS